MKKCIAVLLSLLMVMSLFCGCSSSVENGDDGATKATENAADKQVSTTTTGSGANTYHAYLETNSTNADAKTDIVISADSYVSSDATVENVGVYKDEAGTEKTNVIKWTGEKGSVTYNFTATEAGMYDIALGYCPIAGRGLPLAFELAVDGKVPYDELDSVNFERTWMDSKPEGVSDGNGNLYSSEQIETFIYRETKAMDRTGQQTKPLKVYLSAGEHTVTLTAQSGEFYLNAVKFCAPEQVVSYEEYIKQYSDADYYTGNELKIEGESAKYKSTSSINPLIDNSDPSITPTEPFKEKINYIGSTGWQTPGETLTWVVDVPESGLYKLAFRFRQNMVIDGNSYRGFKVDGVTPFSEAEAIAFGYDGNWQFMELAEKTEDEKEQGEPLYIYLEKGQRELSLSVTLGEMGEISREVNEVTFEIGELYLKIKMITGETVDAGRSYEFFKQIDGFNETLKFNIDRLNSLATRIENTAGGDGGTYAAVIRNMVRVMQEMYDNPYTAQKFIGDYYDNYCSLAALVTDLAEMPLDIDQLILAAPEKEYEKEMAGWWESFVYSCERLIVSFMDDYRYEEESDDGRETLTLWVNWGRDQTQILTSLVKDSFEAEHPNVKVNVQIVNASLIQAILIGSGPDVLLGQVRTEPVNYGMRNALVDLNEFQESDPEGYADVMSRFQEGAITPYVLGNAVYGVPDTQVFNIMFYRTDIFEEMDLEVPKTWDDFRNTTALLQRQNLQAGIAAPAAVGTGVLQQYATFLKQRGATVYNDELTATAFSSGEGIEAFVFWTEFYTNLGYEPAFDFYNRFRSGTMPLGVTSYSQYVLFSQAAPEITGKWAIAKAPGTLQEDGTIDYTQADTGTAVVIPKIADNKELSWEFLKWWTSDTTQYRYSTMVEAVLGEVGRVSTANVEALKRLPWESDDLDILLDAWSEVEGLEEIPGGYYVERSVYQAFWNVVNLSENPKDMIIEWGKVADKEIDRKREEYKDELAKHYN